MPSKAETDWPAVLAILLTGIAGAAQIGKVPAAMTTIGAEFGMGLSGAALLVSLFVLLAGLGGLMIGLAASRIGARRALIGGVAAGALAGLGAALAPGAQALLAARVAEGGGFLMLAVAGPALIAAATAPRERNFAMGLWGTYMPLGIALGLLSAPAVEAFGWRSTWLALAALLGACALLCWRLVPDAPRPAGDAMRLLPQLRALRAARAPFAIAAAFGTYNVVYVCVAAFLPARLEALGAGVGLAGVVAGAAALANAAGNLVSGLLMRRGAPPAALAMGGVLGMAALAAAGFVAPFATLAAALALIGSLAGGLLPAACFAMIPRSVPDPALVPPAAGLVIQANNLTQMIAAPLLGALAAIAWWWLAPALLLAGVASAIAARRLLALRGSAPPS